MKPTSSELTLRELEERERWVAAIDVLLAICASEIRFAEERRAAARAKPLGVRLDEQREIDLREAIRRRAAEDLAQLFRKAS